MATKKNKTLPFKGQSRGKTHTVPTGIGKTASLVTHPTILRVWKTDEGQYVDITLDSADKDKILYMLTTGHMTSFKDTQAPKPEPTEDRVVGLKKTDNGKLQELIERASYQAKAINETMVSLSLPVAKLFGEKQMDPALDITVVDGNRLEAFSIILDYNEATLKGLREINSRLHDMI